MEIALLIINSNVLPFVLYWGETWSLILREEDWLTDWLRVVNIFDATNTKLRSLSRVSTQIVFHSNYLHGTESFLRSW
jgi:hypothetical protein